MRTSTVHIPPGGGSTSRLQGRLLGGLVSLLMLAMGDGQAIQDSRCYLMNGGAVESFFISEDTPVGSVIGTLSVNGDPDESTGNIVLRLQERGAAVGIAPGTKNLTLLRPLDREEITGPSNVYVNVRCDRKRTQDPSFIIPVSVRVWDVNDHAPEWEGAPYSLRVSELTAPGARVLPSPAPRARDRDQPGPHATVHYSVLPGPHSDYIGFVNELDSTLVVKKPLDYETLPKFTITLRASDAGQPPKYNDTTLTVELIDADDQNPRFLYSHYHALLPEGAVEGTELVVSPARLAAVDGDAALGAALQYALAGERRALVGVARDSGRLTATTQLLREPLPLTVVVKATQYDNPDRYALATVTISRASNQTRAQGHTEGPAAGVPSVTQAGGQEGDEPVRFLSPAHAAVVSEAAPPSHALITLKTNTKKPLQFYVSDRSFLEKFAINSAGDVILRRPLDYETQDQYNYQVMLTDGVYNDTTSLNISVVNENEWEPRFRHPHYEFRLPAPAPGEGEAEGGLHALTRLDVHDGDRGDHVTLDVQGPDAELFYVNAVGELFVRRDALAGNATRARLNARLVATDSGRPPKQSSVPLVVHVSAREAEAGARAGAGLRAALCVSLAALAITAAAALAFIFRSKHRKSSATGPAPPPPPYPAREKRSPSPSPRGARGEGAGAGAGGVGGLRAAASLLSVSAGASTILDSTSSLDLRDNHNHHSTTTIRSMQQQQQRFSGKSKVAPLPPGAAAGGSAGAGAGARMSDHIAGEGGRSGVAWPSATIPARVKKLSWDDAETDKGGGETMTEVHDATNPTVADHMNLTVYF